MKNNNGFDTELTQLGMKLQKLILKKIDSHVQPSNAPSTVAKKGFDHPLVENGNLYDSIDIKIDDGTLNVGVLENEDIAYYATVNEFGSKKEPGHPPERSFMRSTWDENELDLLNRFTDDVLNKMEKRILK
jgi:HK97 gp10 family phage protein